MIIYSHNATISLLHIGTGRVKMILLASVFVLFLNSQTGAFNIDTGNVKVLSGTRGSHFGYTMRFDTKALEKGNLDLLIGAPKTHRRIPSGETGGLVTCYDVFNDVTNCREEASDNQFPSVAADNSVWGNDSHIGSGYGFELSVSDSGTRLVCAPFWTDVKWKHDYGMLFMPGRCVVKFERDGITEYQNIMPYFRESQYVLEGNYYTGLAGFGLSTDIHETLLFAVGVPGLTISEGGVAIVDLRDKDERKMFVTSKEYRDTLGNTAYGYLGYKVRFGKFCDNPNICFAASAPNLDDKGVVRLYELANEELIVNFQTLQGEEPFAYYGSALCAADTDGDGIDELLVGTPHYQTGTYAGADIGKVNVYKRSLHSKYFSSLQELPGPRTSWSRFGAAIESIGDINLDRKMDVAIGAPGEEGGSGCVYIYLGNIGGGVVLNQRICANQIPRLRPPINGFGSTISVASVLNKSPYPVFAIGMFQSDKVLVFRSRPILDVQATMTANPNPVDVNENCKFFQSDGPCAVIVLCIRHDVRGSQIPVESQEKQRFRIDLKLGAQQSQSRGMKRAAFVDESGQLMDTLQMSKDVEATGRCFHVNTTIKTEHLERDRFTPIQVEFTYDLEFDQRLTGALSPILDPNKDKKLYNRISFANDCGSDNICHVDLKPRQRLIYPTGVDGDIAFITLGHTKEITVLVTVSNSKESCYWTEIKVRLDQPLVMSKFNSDTIRDCNAVPDVGTTIVCNFFQELSIGDVIGVTLTFETDNLASDRNLSISTEAIARDEVYNPEVEPSDNKVHQIIEVFIVANPSVLGNAQPLEMNINKGKKISPDVRSEVQDVLTPAHAEVNSVSLNHKVLIKNKGPSFLPRTNLSLAIPAYIPDGTLLIVGTSVKLISGKQAFDCFKLRNTSTTGLSTTSAPFTLDSGDFLGTTQPRGEFIPPVKRVKREISDDDKIRDDTNGKETTLAEDTTYTLSCEETPEYCLMFKCPLPRVIPAGGHVELNVTLTLDKDNIPVPQKFESFRLELRTVLEEPEHDLLKPWNATDEKQVVAITHTTFHLYESGGKVEPWIIAVSVLGGFLLIVLIVVICWKVGFFERKRHHQVKTWKRESLKSKRGSQKSRRESQNQNE